MKQVILLVLLGMLASAAAPVGYDFKLRGDIINVNTGKVVLYSPEDTLQALLSTEMKDGQFVLSGRLEEPGLYLLEIAGQKLPIVLDGSDMTLYADLLELSTKLLKGSPALKTRLALEKILREKYEQRLNGVVEKYYELTENGKKKSSEAEVYVSNGFKEAWIYRRELIFEFIQQHPDDLYLPVFIREDMGKSLDYGTKAFDLMSPRLQASQPGRLLKKYLDNFPN